MSVQTPEIDEVIRIEDPATGSSASILPGVGFNCFSFQPMINGKTRDVIWAERAFGPQSPLALNGIPLLFPFAGRLQGESIDFEGRDYRITGALTSNGNVLHGFVISRPWRCLQVDQNRVTGEFHASIDDHSLHDQWPSDFRIRVTYQVEGASLLCEVRIDNPGPTNLPFGFGTHPYFRVFEGGIQSDPMVTVPAENVWVHDGELPSGEQRAATGEEDFRRGVAFSDVQFDGVLTKLSGEPDGLVHTRLQHPDTGDWVDQSFPPAMRNCVVYTPSHREAIAIEPWSCLPNAFAMGKQGIETGLEILSPGASWETRILITAGSH